MKKEELLEEIRKIVREELNKKESPMRPFLPIRTEEPKLDPECLHNGCDHRRNPACNLYCPHCGHQFLSTGPTDLDRIMSLGDWYFGSGICLDEKG